MPSRMLHEAICTSKKLASVSFEAEALYYRLLVKADDYGRYFATPKIIENACFTAGKPTQLKSDRCLKELAEQGLVIVYQSSGEPYLYITGWESKQRIRNSTSKFPAPPVQDAPKENALPKEEDIEDVLFETLTVSASFNNEEIISIERQVRAKESYLDVVAKSAENTYLFELKRNRLSNKSIDQIAGYLDLIDGYGILMGCGVAPNFSFERCEKNGIAVLTYDNEEFKVSVVYKPDWYVQRDFTLDHGKRRDSSLAAVNVNVNVNVNEDVIVNDGGDPPKQKQRIEKIKYAEYVLMTEAEYGKLVEQYGQAKADGCVTILDNYKGANGKKYVSDYRAILNWVLKRYDEDNGKKPTPPLTPADRRFN